MNLRAMVARRYCDVHAAGHICEMGQQAADIAAAACVRSAGGRGYPQHVPRPINRSSGIRRSTHT